MDFIAIFSYALLLIKLQYNTLNSDTIGRIVYVVPSGHYIYLNIHNRRELVRKLYDEGCHSKSLLPCFVSPNQSPYNTVHSWHKCNLARKLSNNSNTYIKKMVANT